jgi:hypothetical protein
LLKELEKPSSKEKKTRVKTDAKPKEITKRKSRKDAKKKDENDEE